MIKLTYSKSYLVNSVKRDIKQLVLDLDREVKDKRFFFGQLKAMGFDKVNDTYYRLLLEHKGERITVGMKIHGRHFTFMCGNKKIIGGYFIEWDSPYMNSEVYYDTIFGKHTDHLQ